ncbi:MAG: hypothetical protein M3Y87_21795 [Myxococcota bacterium]|nr:hypothetical protein [Myxococcota bacterium]
MHRSLVLGALLVAACGGGQAVEQSSDSKPLAAPLASGGDVRMTSDSSARDAPATEARPARPDDLALRASAESPIGPVLPAQLDEYAVELVVRNRSDQPIALGSPHVTVEVWQNARALDECAADPRPIDLPPVLGPGASVAAHVRLPCALIDPGDYDVIAVLVVGAGEQVQAISALDTRSSASTRVTIDDDFGPYGSSVVPPARIYPPGHGALASPVPRDVRPEP